MGRPQPAVVQARAWAVEAAFQELTALKVQPLGLKTCLETAHTVVKMSSAS